MSDILKRKTTSLARYNRQIVPSSPEFAIEPAEPAQTTSLSSGFLEVLWKHKWVMILSVFLSLAAGTTYLLKARPIYTSSARIYVEQNGPQIITSSEGFMTQSKNYLYTQCELFKATPIVSGALDILGTNLQTLAAIDNPTAFLKKKVQADVGKKDDIIKIAFDSPYPQEAAEIVNAVVESYVAYHSRQRRNTTAEVLSILQREKLRRDAELQERLKAITDFKLQNEIISFGAEDSNIIIQRLFTLSDALTQAELEMTETYAVHEAAKLAVADLMNPRQLVNLQRALAPEGRNEIEQLQLKLTLLRQECTPEHPAVEAVEAQLKELCQQRMAVLEQQHLCATNRVDKLQELLAAQRTLAQDLNSKAAQYAMLAAELKRTEGLCDILDNRIKEIDLTEDTGALNISILESAQAPSKPSAPNARKVLAMSLGFGLVLGAGLTLLRDQMDHRLGSAAEISQVLGLPVVGVVPHSSDGADDSETARAVALQPLSGMAEAYRMIRTAVYFGGAEDEMKTVLVTSPAAGEGKSTLSSNLAIAMAQAGQKVLLLDADFRKPSQHRIFNIDDDEIGLSDVLAGGNSFNQAIRPSGIESLDVLPCGSIPPNPSEMLNSRAFEASLDQLSQQYDRIVLDAPPVIPVTDARILGAICDSTLLVLNAEKSSRNTSQHAVEALMGVGGRILGVVVNDVAARKGHYGYHDYGYYHYGHYGNTPHKRLEKNPKEEIAVHTVA